MPTNPIGSLNDIRNNIRSGFGVGRSHSNADQNVDEVQRNNENISESESENEDEETGYLKNGKSNKKKNNSHQLMDENNAYAIRPRKVTYMRKTPIEALKSRRKAMERIIAEKIPELHIIGEIISGDGFGSGISCRWILETGKYWSHVSGEQFGQTQTVYRNEWQPFTDALTWNHPVDVHYTTNSIQGWPRLLVQVSGLDQFSRLRVLGYGFTHVPCQAGNWPLTVECWRPTGSLQDEMSTLFLGTTVELIDYDAIFAKAWEQRCRLITVPSGRVHVNLNIVHRHFEEHNVDLY